MFVNVVSDFTYFLKKRRAKSSEVANTNPVRTEDPPNEGAVDKVFVNERKLPKV